MSISARLFFILFGSFEVNFFTRINALPKKTVWRLYFWLLLLQVKRVSLTHILFLFVELWRWLYPWTVHFFNINFHSSVISSTFPKSSNMIDPSFSSFACPLSSSLFYFISESRTSVFVFCFQELLDLHLNCVFNCDYLFNNLWYTFLFDSLLSVQILRTKWTT